MEKGGVILAIVLLIVGLGIGAGVGRYTAPVKVVTKTETVKVEVMPLAGKTVKFGDIVAQTINLETYTPFLKGYILPLINNYSSLLGYNITFDALLDDAQAQAAIHLEKVQAFHSMGVDLLICGRWSSQAQSALSYVNENNMVMFSPSSTSPVLAIPNDRLFRMCPTDMIQAPAIAKVLASYGIKAIIVIQRGDAWADGIYNILEKECPKLGIEIIDRVRYATEVTEFSSYLDRMESKAKEAVAKYGAEHVAIEPISFNEIVTILTQAKDYPTIYNLMWFGSDGTAMTAQVVDDAPEQGAHVKLLSTLAAPAISPKWDEAYEAYYKLVGMPMDYYTGCTVDIYMTYVNIITQLQSTDPEDVANMIIPMCYNEWGTTGWNKLNEDGDRYAANYDIWGVAMINGKAYWAKYGTYDMLTGQVTWLPEAITPEGLTAPGVTPVGG